MRAKLFEFRNTLLHRSVGINLLVGSDIASGLPVSVIDSVIENVQFIDGPADLDRMCHVWNYSDEIFDIIFDICD